MNYVVDALLAQYSAAKDIRMMRDNVLQTISEFVLPNRGDFTVKSQPGARRDRRVFDSTAVDANQTLASAIHNGLTPPTQQWVKLEPVDHRLANFFPLQQWLEQVRQVIFRVLNSPKSNFYQQQHELLLDLCAYGTACMFVEYNDRAGIIFKTFHISQIYILENANGIVDTVFREFEFTARQAAQEWGEENLSKDIQECLKEKPHKKFKFIHAILPKEDADRIDNNKMDFDNGQPFVSYYIDKKNKEVVSKRGYFEMPYLVPRWAKLVDEIYGRSPAWNALSDILMLNKMEETTIRANQKIADPSLLIADDGVQMPSRVFPGAPIVGGMSLEGRELVKPLNVGGNGLTLSLEMSNQRRASVRRAFFVDKFEDELRGKTPPSATEVADNQNLRLTMMAPQTNRLIHEELDLMIDRLVGILTRSGDLPEMPVEITQELQRLNISGVDFKYSYVGPLANIQRSGELMAYRKAFGIAAPIVQYEPQSLQNLDADKMIRDIFLFSGVPAVNMKQEREVSILREQIAEQAQQQQEFEQANAIADSAAKLNKSGVDLGI